MPSIEPIKHRTVNSTAADGRRSTTTVTLPRRDWRWRARYRDPGGRSRSRTFTRKTDAERFLHENGADLNRGEWVDPALRRGSFRMWAEEWRATTVRLAPTTRRSYIVLLDNHVLAWFGDRPQASIDFLEVERFIAAKLASGLGPKRVRAAVSVLSLVMRLVVRAGGRKDNPAAGHVIRKVVGLPGDNGERCHVLPRHGVAGLQLAAAPSSSDRRCAPRGFRRRGEPTTCAMPTPRSSSTQAPARSTSPTAWATPTPP